MTGDGSLFLNELLKHAYSGNGTTISRSPFGTTAEGWLDFRAVSVPGQTQIRKLQAMNADFSGAQFNGAWLEGCIFDHITFDQADFGSVADHGNLFRNCSFRKAKFRRAALGYRGTRFERCQFQSAGFHGAIFIRPEFDDCNFDTCDLDGAHFDGSSFRRCSFRGLLKDVWFRGGFESASMAADFGEPRPNLMEQVSFAEAELIEPTFSDRCKLSSVVLPANGQYLFYQQWKRRLQHVLESANNWPDRERKEVEIFCRCALTHAATQDEFILNKQDLVQEFGEVLAKKVLIELDRVE
jgi:uncharacterized protein YjbI with pentapeptide repeats